MSEQRWNLPAGWAWANASDIAQIVGGGTPASRDGSNFAERGIPWITPADLTGYESAYIARGRRDLSQRGYISCGARLIPKGSVLFSSRAPIGYCVIAEKDLCTNQGFKSMVLRGEMLPEFVRYYLLSAKGYAESLASGTTFLELSASRMASMQIPVAPIVEQHRIVGKLDRLFERIAKARVELMHVGPLLQRYKLSLLQAAYDGSLIGRSDALYRPLGEVAEHLSYGTSRKSHVEARGIAVLRIPNISGGEIDLSDLKYSEFEKKEYERLQLKIGDLLIVRSNGSPDLVGRPAVVGEEAAGMAYAGYLIRIRPKTEAINPHYLAFMVQAPTLRAQVESEVTSTSGVHNVNAKQLASLSIPILPMEQQDEIVDKLNGAFNWLRRVEAESRKALDRLMDLHGAILSKAFRGSEDGSAQTVNQDDMLLNRIREAAQPKLPILQTSLIPENLMADEPREWLLKDSLDWPSEGLAFEDVAKRVSVEYDQIRDSVFALLAGDTPELTQVFDVIAGRILLKRNAT